MNYNLSIGDNDRGEELKARISYITSATGLNLIIRGGES